MAIRQLPRPLAHTVARSRPVAMPAAARLLPAFARDLALALSVVGLYFLLRGLVPDREGFATAVSQQIVAFEQAAGIFWEPAIQDWSIRWHATQELANFTYAYLHFPVLGAVGLWLWWRDRERFVFVRNVMFVSMVIGLAFYWLVPATPPRLLAEQGIHHGFTDTVFGGNTAVKYAQPSYILNEYAAIPSFHFGWIALAAAAIWTNTVSRAARGAALFLALLMTWAIVASANHYFVDMALGGLVIVVAWRAAEVLDSRRARAALAPA